MWIDVYQRLCFALLAGTGLFAAHTAGAYTVYVSSEKDNVITVIDGETLQQKAQVKVGERPRGIALSKDLKSLYVCTSDEDHIEVLDLTTLQVTHILPSGPDPELLALGPEGRFLYVANEDDNMVTMVDVVERSWNDVEPAFRLEAIGVGKREIYNLVFTRPRFASQVAFEGSVVSDGSVHDDDDNAGT